MANLQRFFNIGKMNKVVDERLVPNGEYIDALNVRMGSTEDAEIGVVTNTKGNTKLTFLNYNGTLLSDDARCIGAFEDGSFETVYWCIHDPSFVSSPTGKLDMVVSYNTNNGVTTYHVISMWDGQGIAAEGNTTLNFDPSYLITGFNKINDLLFFTDGNVQPRQINVKRNYPIPVAGVDQFTEQEILVIKKPPIAAPTVLPLSTSLTSEFLKERFVCFAYRYRYKDDQYSATSQWSAPSFVPDFFLFSISSNLNEGMVNITNSAKITFNSGSRSVIGVDILFKDMGNPIIKLVEKLDKNKLGYADDTEYSYVFDNSKIFSVLPSDEIVRLYDNVPLTAEAQTIMGNRIMYGNYTEGGDMVDLNGNPTKLEYMVDLISSEISLENIPYSIIDSAFTFGNSNTYPDTAIRLNLTELEDMLVAGSSIEFTITFTHSNFFSGGNPFPSTRSGTVNIDVIFLLQADYDSVYDMAISDEFRDTIGTLSNILTVADSCNGITLTDEFNCEIPNTLGESPYIFYKYESGISAAGQPINIIAIDGDSFIELQIPAMRFVDDVNTPTISIYEYYQITSASARFSGISNPTSLHSNRGYEVAISYMDEYSRSSTALVSKNNNLYIPCSESINQNKIQVTIPTSQIAPSWAKRYKFFIKPDKTDYETIYSRFYYNIAQTNTTWFLLEGENAAKVEKGDRYIIKSDSAGPVQNCAYTTVLEKEALGTGIAGSGSQSGAYMKLETFNFSTTQVENQHIYFGERTVVENDSGDVPIMTYGLSLFGTTWEDYTIPQGSTINFYVRFIRKGTGDGTDSCERREYIFDKQFTASSDYNSIEDWFYGDNFGASVNSGVATVLGNGVPIINQFASVTATAFPTNQSDFRNYWTLYRDGSNQLSLVLSGTTACGSSNKKESKVIANISVHRAGSIVVFETEPLEAAPDIWFESNQVFDINDDGEHMGNVQDQDIVGNLPAIIDTNFFNCWTFGNGVESYKIRDSIIGRVSTLGNRVSSTQEKDYELSERFADITYSGIYNEESNVNKLNEFNLGLLNFKNLEVAFGPIKKMFGRKKDVMVLQEDRISYVLSGANILSDLSAGNLLTSVPDVLGDQFVRVEEYGISNNPESFVEWGGMKYFTDAKRGAVIQLNGGAEGQDQLTVISEAGMRTYFRDLFINAFNTQKLGGYDPYMNEYVLSNNTILRPSNAECVACGTILTFNVSPDNPIEFCTDFTSIVGDVQVSWRFIGQAAEELIYEHEFSSPVTFGDICDGWRVDSGVTTIYEVDGFGNDVLTVENGTNFSINYALPTEIGARYRVEWEITETPRPNATFEVRECLSGLIITAVEVHAVPAIVTQEFVATTEISRPKVFMNPDPFSYKSFRVYRIPSETITVETDYGGGITSSGTTSTGGAFIFDKDSVSVNQATTTITSSEPVVVQIEVSCPQAQIITIVEVVITGLLDVGKFIHTEYRWDDGLFTSPLHSALTEFQDSDDNPIVSRYNLITGPQGAGIIPSNTATVRLYTNKFAFDDFVFDTNYNKFRYLRTDTVYSNNETDINLLLGAATVATPLVDSGAPTLYYSDFVMPATTESRLYLIWDLRRPFEIELCYGATAYEACCEC